LHDLLQIRLNRRELVVRAVEFIPDVLQLPLLRLLNELLNHFRRDRLTIIKAAKPATPALSSASAKSSAPARTTLPASAGPAPTRALLRKRGNGQKSDQQPNRKSFHDTQLYSPAAQLST
jgi:hypothetical protein